MVKLILREEESDQARALYDALLLEQTPLVAPPLLPIEITNVMRKRTRGPNAIPVEEAANLLRVFLALPIAVQTLPGIHQQALMLAIEFNVPATYDAHYLALAEMLGCEFWTADQRLVRQVARRLPFVRWLGEYEL